MRVVVTGGSGQLGTLVLRRLAGDRTCTGIVSIDVRPPLVASSRIRAVNADVRDPGLEKHFEGADALVHLAFLVMQHAPGGEFESINVGGSKSVFESAARAGVRRIVYASSVAAYGCVPGHPVPIVESTPRRLQADFPYSATKYAVEEFLDGFERAHPNIAVARLRPGILFGARMDHPLGRALRKRVLIDTDGPEPPIVWDEDVADAVILALRKTARGAFNLVADDSISGSSFAALAHVRRIGIPQRLLSPVARLGEMLAKAGVKQPVDPAWSRAAGAHMVVSSARAKAELGWQPTCPTAADVARRLGEASPGRLDPKIAVFLQATSIGARRVKPPADVARVSLKIHLDLTGPGGGDVTLAIDHGRLRIARGMPRPPDAVIWLRASTFLDVLSGRTSMATALLTGAIRSEGEPLATQVLSAIVAVFLAEARRSGVRGWPARRLARWIEMEPRPQGSGGATP